MDAPDDKRIRRERGIVRTGSDGEELAIHLKTGTILVSGQILRGRRIRYRFVEEPPIVGLPELPVST